MILYSIDPTFDTPFNRIAILDEFVSAIWTERFIEATDVTISLPAVHKNLKFLAPGSIIGCGGSRELCLLETRSIEGGVVTATGKAIETYFNERHVEATTMISPARDIMRGLVTYMQNTPPISGMGSMKIEGLRADAPSPDTDTWTEDIPDGPVYDTLLTLAKKYNVGHAVYWQRTAEHGQSAHELVYTNWYGRNLTGETPGAVRFSPELDNLGDVKQMTSIAGSKNIFGLKPPDWANPLEIGGGLIWSTKDSEANNRFRDRYITVDTNDIQQDSLKGDNDVEKMLQLYRIMNARHFAAVEQYKRQKIVDGEITPETQYVYKRDYFLGDMVEVQGDFGEPIHGVVTEYIRSHDESGERAYPTVAAPPDPITGPDLG